MTATPSPTVSEQAPSTDTGSGEETPALDTDDVFHLLQNQRRRRTLRYLHEHDDGEGVDMRDIVEWIAAKEHDTTVQALRSKERQRVYIALYQAHLPKLDKLGIVDYDQRRGWVELRDEADAVMPYLSVDDDEPEATDESAGSFDVFTYTALGASALFVALAVTGAYAVSLVPAVIATIGVAAALGSQPVGTRVRSALDL